MPHDKNIRIDDPVLVDVVKSIRGGSPSTPCDFFDEIRTRTTHA